MIVCETRSPDIEDQKHIKFLIDSMESPSLPKGEGIKLLGLVILTLVLFVLVTETMDWLFGSWGVFVVATPFCLWVMVLGHDMMNFAPGHKLWTPWIPKRLLLWALWWYEKRQADLTEIRLHGLLRNGEIKVTRVHVTAGYAFMMGARGMYFFGLRDGKTLYYVSDVQEHGTWPSDIFEILIGYQGGRPVYHAVRGVGGPLKSLEVFEDPADIARLEPFFEANHKRTERRFHEGHVLLNIFDEPLDAVYARYLSEPAAP